MTVTVPETSARRASTQPQLAVVAAIGLLMLRRRRIPAALLALFVISVTLSLSGCGARTASEAVLPVQTYPLSVQATGTNLAGNVVVHTVSVTLAVE
jgi:hypothetical protein